MPAFLAEPFVRKTWAATLDSLFSLPIGIVSFSYVVVMMAFGIGTAITLLGLPVIAAAVAGARGWGRMERTRAVALLGVRIPAPRPMSFPGPRLFGWLKAALTDGPGWRGLLYLFLLLPLVLSFLAPWVVRGCAAVRGAMARGLLRRIGEER